jgi:hypothetical protein
MEYLLLHSKKICNDILKIKIKLKNGNKEWDNIEDDQI